MLTSQGNFSRDGPFVPHSHSSSREDFREPFIPRPRDEFGDPIDDYEANQSIHSRLLQGEMAFQETDTSLLSSLHSPEDSLNSNGENPTEYSMGPVLRAMLDEWDKGDELLSKKKRKRKTSREHSDY